MSTLRVRSLTLASLIGLGSAGATLVAACGSTEETPASADGGPSRPDAASDVAVDGSYPLLPYPPGPYGTGLGDVMPDLVVRGYALSRQQRDSSKLPLRDVSLAEVRSDPTCTCLVILFNAAGERCGPCALAAKTMAALVANDTSLCAMEAIVFTYDTLVEGEGAQPPTRADLDLHSQAARQSFPVGLATMATMDALGALAYPGIPDHLVIRPGDMRMVGFVSGTGSDIARDVRTACASPAPGIERVAALSTPRSLVVDGSHAYVADAELGVLRVPKAGGAPQVLAKPAGGASGFVVDGTHVYWSTYENAASFEIGRVQKDGGGGTVLATSTSGYRSIAADGTNVYFARNDGVIGRVPLGGGAAETLLTGEASATSLQVDATDLYWVDASKGDLVTAPKGGGPRRVFVAASSLRFELQAQSLVLAGDKIFFRSQSGRYGQIFVVPKSGGVPENAADTASSAFAVDAAGADLVIASLHPPSGAATIGTSPAQRNVGEFSAYLVTTPGQRDVVAVAGDGEYTYWVDDPETVPRTGALKRIRR